MPEKDHDWILAHFVIYLADRVDTTETDIYSLPLDTLQEMYSSDWADFAVLEGV